MSSAPEPAASSAKTIVRIVERISLERTDLRTHFGIASFTAAAVSAIDRIFSGLPGFTDLSFLVEAKG